jgi:hypothetical protein
MKDILVVHKVSESQNAVDEALRVAKSDSRKARVLQILDSGLYLYGHNDLVAPRLSKRTFLLYIRDQVLEQGGIEAEEIRRKAKKMGIELEIDPVETDDLVSTVVDEAKKGYEMVFLAREKKKLFPLLHKHLATHLRKKSDARVIEC